uniref:Sodium/hydrogen exchanger 9-like n=1 Tax=Seriola lalandi dorsalis TaxID=1841481 RepID=A0A3B4YFK3_SERLL
MASQANKYRPNASIVALILYVHTALAADADVAAAESHLNLIPKSLTWALKMSSTVGHRQDTAAVLVLAAVSLALLTILSVWKLKQFKYRLINETGGKRFFENMGSVLTFAFLGTIISFITIGACVYGFTRLMVLLGQAADGEFSLTDCLLFGAIMSATDPVSVLGLLSDLHVDPDLHTLLFGESVLNDAVAIVLSHAINTYSQMGAGRTFNPPAFLHSVGYFLGVLAGSLLLGFIFTVITALISFHFHPKSPLVETSVLFLLSWSSFLSAEASGLSGIVAVLFCGLSQARYTIHNLSSEGRARTKQLFEVFNFLGEIFIFSFMGYVLLMFPYHVFKALFISGAFLSIFISRACNIYPLSFLLNLGRTNKIPATFQHFMMFAGLRGAVALSLAVRDTSTEVGRTILTTSLLLVCFTIWVLGTAADPMLQTQSECCKSDLSSRLSICQSPSPVICGFLCQRYLKPLLTHCGPPLTDSLPQWCGALARLFGSPRVQEVRLLLCYYILLTYGLQSFSSAQHNKHNAVDHSQNHPPRSPL